MRWTKEDIDFLINNYYKNGAQFIADKLNRTRQAVLWQAKQRKLRVAKSFRRKSSSLAGQKARKYEINVEEFKELKKPEIVYLLGLIWADGSLSTSNRSSITFQSLMDDIKELMPVFNKTGVWRYRIIGGKYIRCYVNAYRLFDWLESLGYLDKSGGSALKILTSIPEDLRHLWWRGYLDGDGHISSNPKKRKVVFTSNFTQNWDFMSLLPVPIYIYQHSYTTSVAKVHKSSQAMTQNSSDIIRLLEYIYKDYPVEHIGLTRKYNKYLQLRRDGSVV